MAVQLLAMARNVCLIVLDCVRKDYFDAYAPRLQELADVSFDTAVAASSWSVPSHASLFTGELASQHGIHAEHIDFSALSPEETFLDDLPDHRTIATSTNLFAGPTFGFDHLFDEFPNVSRHGVVPGGVNIEQFHRTAAGTGARQYLDFLRYAVAEDALVPSLVNGLTARVNSRIEELPVPRVTDYGARAIVRGTNKWLQSDDEPFFFFANFMEAHSPYHACLLYDNDICRVPLTWRDPLDSWEMATGAGATDDPDAVDARRRIYAGSVDYLDRVVSRFIERLVARTDNPTTVVVTADHGENLSTDAEDGQWGHFGMSHPLLHVPLVVVNPPSSYTPETSRPISHLDLGAHVVSIVRDSPLPPSRDRIPAERIGLGVVDEEDVDDYAYWDRARRCVYEAGERFEWDSLGNTARYRITGPSTETRQATGEDVPPEYTALFERSLGEYKNQYREGTPEVSASTEAQLRELGYL
jgi:arylsulfatase A-like enzyme